MRGRKDSPPHFTFSPSPPMRTVLRARTDFSAFGRSYAPGSEITEGDLANWNKMAPESLANRLQGGDVAYEWEGLEEARAPVAAPDKKPHKSGDELTAMTKTDLAAYAMDAFGVELDVNDTKATLVAEILLHQE